MYRLWLCHQTCVAQPVRNWMQFLWPKSCDVYLVCACVRLKCFIDLTGISALLEAVPPVSEHFEVLSKIGEGVYVFCDVPTPPSCLLRLPLFHLPHSQAFPSPRPLGTFSAVFLARLKVDGEEGSCFALKHIVPTSAPCRMENELRCLQVMG